MSAGWTKGPLEISEPTQAELDYTMRKGYPSGFNGDMAAELDSLVRYAKQPLFKAAPEMAEALEKLLEEAPLVRGNATALWSYLAGWEDAARAALRKARGEV